MNSTIKIGTRGSLLAVRQAEIVCSQIKSRFPKIDTEIIKISTIGDKNLNISVDKIGGKGVFVKEIENSLINGYIDIAVHSMKDMPADMPEGLCIGAVLERENPFDALISKKGYNIFTLPAGAKVGTGSGRRKYQIIKIRPDLQVIPIRGNIITRLNKLDEGLDAVVLAAAGLKRMGLEKNISQIFTSAQMIPAVCQGILAIQIRKNDRMISDIVSSMNDKYAFICAEAERAFLKKVGADCHSPVGGYAYIEGENIFIEGFFYNGFKLCRVSLEGSIDNPKRLGEELGKFILEEAE